MIDREHVTDRAGLLSRIADLEREREHLLCELREMKQSLAKAGCGKADFPGRMSHDMRTPLSRIMGFTEIMRDGMAGPVTDAQKEYLADVFASACQLNALINNMFGQFEGTGRQSGGDAEGVRCKSDSGR